MTLHDIKTELYRLKIKPAQIAEVAGVSPITVRSILNGHGTSRPVKAAVAVLLGSTYEAIWADHELHKDNLSANEVIVNV